METTIATRHTYADYAKLPEGVPYQLIEGELVKKPARTTHHQRVQSTFGFLLTAYVSRNQLGRVYYAPTNAYLADDEVYQPDILFVAADRLGIIEEKYIKGVIPRASTRGYRQVPPMGARGEVSQHSIG